MQTKSLDRRAGADLHGPVSAGLYRAAARPVLGHRDARGRHVLHDPLMLDHPVFAYVRARILADRQCLDRSLLTLCVNHLAERDILAGDFAGAQALLEAFADLDTSLVRGMMELVQGRVPEARQAFDLSLRNGGKSKTAQMEHLGTFPGVLHALLLVQSDEAEGPPAGADLGGLV